VRVARPDRPARRTGDETAAVAPPTAQTAGAGHGTYHFAGCRVEVDAPRALCETIFPDGAVVRARPQATPSYRARAAQLGYGGDAAACSREHELLHCWLAEKCGHPVSPTLWAVAHRRRIDPDSAGFEEDLVMGFQRFLNTARKSKALRVLVWMGHDLQNLRRDALVLLRAEREHVQVVEARPDA
jgi:hypothetical protein